MNEVAKIQPQAIDLEQAVLGAIMLEKDAFPLVADVLIKDNFYKDQHKYVYEACEQLFSKAEPIDMLTVTNKLREMGKLEKVGGAFYITELTRGVNSSANIESHARVIFEMAVKRNLITISSTIYQKGYEDTTDALSLADEALNSLYEAVGNLGVNIESIKNIVHRWGKSFYNKDNIDVDGIRTHLTGLNNIIGGWKKPDLIILAARPGMGKTAFMLNAIKECAEQEFPCAVFSLEMSKEQLINRLISTVSEINSNNLKNPNEYEMEQVSKAIGRIENMDIHIDDTAGLTIVQFRSTAMRLVQSHGIKLIVVDYLQLMHGDRSDRNKLFNREQEVSAITRALKATAKDLKVPIIALSQLSRALETRSDKRPMLSDLRESGSIEQDADIVIFLYRPEYYGITEDENGTTTNNVCEIIIAKHRNGDVGMIPAKFIKEIQKFTDYEENTTHFGTAIESIDKFETQYTDYEATKAFIEHIKQ